ncbi:hypothetical protein JCM11251_006098 [Rhodosporidiobolus azoricus]
MPGSMVNTTSKPSTVVSCPGKVLFAGGYLVLDPAYRGFVVGTPSRFYTAVQDDDLSRREANETDAEEQFRVTVVSPQFEDGKWVFEARKTDGEWVVNAVPAEGSSSNTFVHLSIQATLQIASALSPATSFRDLLITIVGSNDFYSQSRATNKPIPFAPLKCTIGKVHKTGLGSSAAMVTSLTSSLLLHWTAPPFASSTSSDGLPNPDEDTIALMHNLAQYVHSLAQGKVGSGFDVSAAVYGSQEYKRFAIECLEDLLDPTSTRGCKITSQALLSVLSSGQNPAWTASATAGSVLPFSLPPHTLLILADVDAGSNTPSMVGKVNAWKKAQPEEADRVWRELGEVNERFRELFAKLTEAREKHEEDYVKEVERLSKLPAQEWSSSTLPIAAAATNILEFRSLMRYMGEQSGVPIEPPEQTQLLDACSAIPGVVGAGVPGAGGYDAIWVLCLAPPTFSSSSSSPSPASEVEALLRSYTGMSVRPLSTNAWVKGGTFEGEAGLLREKVEGVDGLREAMDRGRKQ